MAGSNAAFIPLKTLRREFTPQSRTKAPLTFARVKKYGLTMMVTADDQVKAYIKKIMSQLKEWMYGGKISKLVVVVTSKETGEHVERWQFDVSYALKEAKFFAKDATGPNLWEGLKVQVVQEDERQGELSARVGPDSYSSCGTTADGKLRANDAEEKTETEIQAEIQSIFRQITASVTFLPMLDGNCTFNVLVYADADSEVPLEWGDSDAKEIKNGEKVQLRSFSTSNHRVDTLVSYRCESLPTVCRDLTFTGSRISACIVSGKHAELRLVWMDLLSGVGKVGIGVRVRLMSAEYWIHRFSNYHQQSSSSRIKGITNVQGFVRLGLRYFSQAAARFRTEVDSCAKLNSFSQTASPVPWWPS
jgi:mitotic spindle assembly checkpoint protein MAD2